MSSAACGMAALSLLILWNPAEAAPFKYGAKEVWVFQETMTMNMEDPQSGTEDRRGGKVLSRMSLNEVEYSVMKLFPDGAALVAKKILKNLVGTSFDALQERPLPGGAAVQHLLLTGDGSTYLVQASPNLETTEEQAAAEMLGMKDEVGELQKAKTTKGFLKDKRHPMDMYKIATKPVKVGGTVKRDGFTIKRLKDEQHGNVLCEVYRAERHPIFETTWFDRKHGRVLKRILMQGIRPGLRSSRCA